MNDWSFLWSFALVWGLAVMLPGPNFLMALKSGLGGGRGEGVLAALGIATGSILWATGTMLGLNVLFQTFAWLYEGLKVVGGLYLLYLGVITLRSAMTRPVVDKKALKATLSGYRGGVLTNLSNPKTAAFFGSIFMTLLPPDPTVAQLAAVPPVVFVISFSWYSLVALAFSLGGVRAVYERVKRPLSACIGGLLLFFGARLLLVEE